MKPLKFYITVKDGDFNYDSPDYVNEKLHTLKDGHYTQTWEKSGKRTTPQNRYFHGPVLDLVFDGLRDAGFDEIRDKEDAKILVKSLFLTRQISNGVETFTVVRDTHDLTTEEMIIFIDDIIRWAAEYLSISIPPPSSQSKLFAV